MHNKKCQIHESCFFDETTLYESKMSEFHMHIKDGKTAQQIARIMKLDLKTVKVLMKGVKESYLYERFGGDTNIPADKKTTDIIQSGKAKILINVKSALHPSARFVVIERPLGHKGELRSNQDKVLMATISDPKKGRIKMFSYHGTHVNHQGAMKFAKNNKLVARKDAKGNPLYAKESYLDEAGIFDKPIKLTPQQLTRNSNPQRAHYPIPPAEDDHLWDGDPNTWPPPDDSHPSPRYYDGWKWYWHKGEGRWVDVNGNPYSSRHQGQMSEQVKTIDGIKESYLNELLEWDPDSPYSLWPSDIKRALGIIFNTQHPMGRDWAKRERITDRFRQAPSDRKQKSAIPIGMPGHPVVESYLYERNKTGTTGLVYEFPNNRLANQFAKDMSNSGIATTELVDTTKVQVQMLPGNKSVGKSGLSKYLKQNRGKKLKESFDISDRNFFDV